MASCITAQWDTHKATMTSPQMKLTVTEQSSDGDSVVLAWVLQYIASYPANTNGNIAYKVIIGGSTQKDSSYDIDGKTGTYNISSGTVTVAKSTAARDIAFSITAYWDITWSGTYCASKVASSSITIDAKESYTVSYNANGGSGAPTAQVKWYGTDLTLSKATPTRTGYAFKGWSTSNDSSVEYAAGAKYTANKGVTLYAVWQANTYPIKYDANGGSGAPANQAKTYGVTLKLSSTVPTRKNYIFLGWGTSASSTTVSYAAGANYTANAGITLYAIWKLAYKRPRITGLAVTRCIEDGTASDEGTCAKVVFSWATDQEVTAIDIAWTSYGGGSGSHPVEVSGTSGKVTEIVGAGELSADATFTVGVTVEDGGGSTAASTTLAGFAYTMDFLAGGKGVSMFKPAEKEGFEVGGDIFDQFSMKIGNGLAEYTGSGDAAIDPDTTLEHIVLTNKNTPDTSFWYILTFFYNTKSVDSNRAQIAIPYSVQKPLKKRRRLDNTWGAWEDDAGLTTHYHKYQTSAGGMLFTPDWMGFYGSFANAYEGKDRKAWMGHDGTNTFTISNQAGGTMDFFASAAAIRLFGASTTSFVAVLADRLRANANDVKYLGDSTYRWKAVYAVNGTIQTSDREQKTNIAEIDQKYIDLFDRLQPVTFKFTGSEHDRVHIGLIAQDVKEAMDELGISSEEFAAYCRDKKIETIEVIDPKTGEKSEQDIEVLDEDGNPVYLYSLRYTEFISLNTRMIQENRKKITALEEENAKMKQRLNKIEAMLGIEGSEVTA